MYTFSNILSIYQMVSDRLVLSNLLYNSELDYMGGVKFNSQNITAHIAPL